MDEHSDLDLVFVCAGDADAALLDGAKDFAAGLGPLLVSFTGEHVGEPRLLIALYGPPPAHVDLKFVVLADLSSRVEDGLVLWQRDEAVTTALAAAPAVWPQPDAQWIEDRYWVWVHYIGAKIVRGELFEAIDGLNALRAWVLGPLVARNRGLRAQGVRRIEQSAPADVPLLRATLPDYSAAGCLAALRAAVEAYAHLRAGGAVEVERRTAAEEATRAWLEALRV